MKGMTIGSLSLFLLLFFSGCKQTPEKIIGIKIYEYNKDFNALVDKWIEMGINTAFMSKELAADTSFRKVLREHDICVFIIFPVFYNPELLKRDSTLYAITNKGKIAKNDWVEFVCPSRSSYRKMKIGEAADLIKRLDPDGLSIDFIRQFVFWEMIYPGSTAGSIERACFCDSCVNNFCLREGISIPDSCLSTIQKAKFISENCSVAWDRFRCDLITSMVKELSEKAHEIKAEIKINFHAVPWRDEDFGGANINVAGQDLNKISPYVDFISPMCYSQMLRRDPKWIASVISEMDKKAPGKIIPSIQVFQYYVDDPFTPANFSECIDEALKYPSKGVSFFSWPLFEKDPVRMNIKRTSFR
jgi:hypothetical protein